RVQDCPGLRRTVDLTTLATPAYFATMAAEHRVLARRAEAEGPSPADYVRPDTIASLSMGVGSLLMPLATRRLVRTFALGRGRWGWRLLGATAVAAAATTVADRVVRRADSERRARQEGEASRNGATPPPEPPIVGRARTVARVGGVAAIAGAGVLATATAAHRLTPQRMWKRGQKRDLGTGPLAWLVALVGWDVIYYWNHRLMHEIRALWAHHVVHHSSERYNLSTALRQPVSPFGVWIPYGILAR